MILVVGKGSNDSNVSEKIVPVSGSVRSVSPPSASASASAPGSTASATYASASATTVVVTSPVVARVAPMPESTTVGVTTIEDLGRKGVDVNIGEPICVEVKEASDMDLDLKL